MGDNSSSHPSDQAPLRGLGAPRFDLGRDDVMVQYRYAPCPEGEVIIDAAPYTLVARKIGGGPWEHVAPRFVRGCGLASDA